MKTVIAISLDRKFELVTNGNYQFWTRPTVGYQRSRYEEFAGRKQQDAALSLNARTARGY